MGREGESEGGRAASCPPPACLHLLASVKKLLMRILNSFLCAVQCTSGPLKRCHISHAQDDRQHGQGREQWPDGTMPTP